METPAPIAFRLRDAYADNFGGGIISIDGQEFDTSIASHGHIDVDDVASVLDVQPHLVVDALDNSPAFIRVGEDEADPEPDPATIPLDKLTKDALTERAEALGLEVAAGDTKADIIAALTAYNDAEGGEQA